MARSIGGRPITIYGTVSVASGTLSDEIDMGEVSAYGLIYRNAVNGTIGFKVSDKSDADGGVYYDLKDLNGNNIALGPTGTEGAISFEETVYIAPYRYVRVKFSSAQTNGVSFIMPGRA